MLPRNREFRAESALLQGACGKVPDDLGMIIVLAQMTEHQV